MAEASLPQGVVIFLLTDIEGSTAAWENRTQSMIQASRLHDEWGEETITKHGGHLLKKKLAGDALFAVFEKPTDAIRAVVALQQLYQTAEWPGGATIRVRMGLHLGESADTRNEDYFGPVVNRCARIQGVANGGQILVSDELVKVLEGQLGNEIWFEDLGEHRLKDLSLPVRLHQVCAEGLQSEFPPVNSISGFPNNLPTQTSSFVGRQQELEDLRKLVLNKAVVVLLGPGGTGKTRLSLQVAAELIDQFAQGTWFVALDQIHDGTPVATAVAETIGIQERPGQSTEQTVLSYLKERQIFLVLDNSEHLVQEVTAFTSKLAASCPKVRVLATTRERLRVPGAATYDLDPLPVGSEAADMEELLGSPAVQLFVDRASEGTQKFEVDQDSVRLIAKLCATLDGVPYMIELAAARARTVPLETILARIDDRFRVLGKGDLTRVPRQQSLRALIDWSYDLLDADQKVVFARLATFVGGCTLEAAESVIAADPIDEFDVVDHLSSLVDKSLVAFDQFSKRYRMLETVRKYAGELLAQSGEQSIMDERHCSFFATVATRIGDSMGKEEELALYAACDKESENLRKLLHTAAERAPSTAVQVLVHLFRYFDARARYSEPRGILESLIAHPDVGEDPKLVTSASQALGNLCRRQGDFDSAATWFERGLVIAQGRQDQMAVASILANLATICLYRADFERAIETAKQGIAASSECKNWRAVVTCNLVLTNVFSSTGELRLAQLELEEAKTIVEREKFFDLVAYVESNLALNLVKQGEFTPALALFAKRARALAEEGNRPTLLEVLRFSAEALLGAHRHDDSAALYRLEERLREAFEIGLSESDLTDRSHHMEALKCALGASYATEASRWDATRSEQELFTLGVEFLQQFAEPQS